MTTTPKKHLVCVTLNDDTRSTLCYEMNDEESMRWLQTLPPEIAVDTADFQDRPWSIDDELINSVKSRLGSALLGACEGAATGTATGSNITGAGLWLVGGLWQVIGAFVGFTLGTLTFAGMGALTDADTVRFIASDYRLCFGRVGSYSDANKNTTTATKTTC